MFYELLSPLLRITLVYFATSSLLCPDVLRSILLSSNTSKHDTSKCQRLYRPTVIFRIVMYLCVRNVPMNLGESRTILATQG